MYGEVESIKHSELVTEKWLLTNCIWQNGHGKCPETGYRRKLDNGTWGDFHLIQHGWWDFEMVNKIIIKALNKGWDYYRTLNFLDGMKARYRK